MIYQIRLAKKEGHAKMTTVQEYLERAEECAQFANKTKDDVLRADLLTLRQKYLRIAERLRGQESGQPE